MGDQFWENPLEVSVRNGNLTFKGCKMTQLVGDGYCNDETNNIHCAFDGGDCCNNTAPNWDYYCTIFENSNFS